MRRPRAGNAAVNVSLFPFLAVLISTMGALILLLVVIAEQTHRTATAAQAHEREAAARDATRLADAATRVSRERETLLAALAEARRHNTALHDAIIRAEQDSNRLAAQLAADDDSTEDDSDERRLALLAEITELDHAINKSRAERERLGGVGERHSKSYAVVPYQGQYGTRRRPVYIECTAEGVILQPEGVEIRTSELDTPFGKINPLSHAVEAANDHLMRLQHTDAGRLGVPYPLLLVRPGGVKNFYLARLAVSAATGEFGYELVEDDWQLEYPEVDEELALVLDDAVKQARRMQLHLARSAPRLGRSMSEYGGSGGGGDGNGPGGDALPATAEGANHFGGSGSAAGAVGTGSLTGNGTAPTGSRDMLGTNGGAAGVTSSGGAPSVTSMGASAMGTPGGPMPPAAPLHPMPLDSPAAATGSAGPGGGGPGSGSGSLNADQDRFAFDNAPNGGAASATPSFDDPPTSSGPSGSTAATPGPQLISPQPGGGNGASQAGSAASSGGPVTPSARGFAADMSSPATGTSGGAAAAGGGSPHGLSGQSAATSGAASSGSVSSSAIGVGGTPPTRGSDNRDLNPSHGDEGEPPWALANTAGGAIPVTRPIRVRVDAERFVVLSADGRRERNVVKFTDDARDTLSDVVSAVWDYTDTWGLAGRGLYWSPVLVAEVSPDGIARYEQLKHMLSDSGLQLKLRSTSPRAAAQPTAPRRGVR
ncbi:MAG: hypothetical protein R3C10_24795 [Pirellulales bacterium]